MVACRFTFEALKNKRLVGYILKRTFGPFLGTTKVLGVRWDVAVFFYSGEQRLVGNAVVSYQRSAQRNHQTRGTKETFQTSQSLVLDQYLEEGKPKLRAIAM